MHNFNAISYFVTITGSPLIEIGFDFRWTFSEISFSGAKKGLCVCLEWNWLFFANNFCSQELCGRLLSFRREEKIRSFAFLQDGREQNGWTVWRSSKLWHCWNSHAPSIFHFDGLVCVCVLKFAHLRWYIMKFALVLDATFWNIAVGSKDPVQPHKPFTVMTSWSCHIWWAEPWILFWHWDIVFMCVCQDVEYIKRKWCSVCGRSSLYGGYSTQLHQYSCFEVYVGGRSFMYLAAIFRHWSRTVRFFQAFAKYQLSLTIFSRLLFFLQTKGITTTKTFSAIQIFWEHFVAQLLNCRFGNVM